jgi:hypothetical protein
MKDSKYSSNKLKMFSKMINKKQKLTIPTKETLSLQELIELVFGSSNV